MSALLQHLPSYLGFSYLGRGVSLHGYSSNAQPLLLTLDEGYLLTAAVPDLPRERLLNSLYIVGFLFSSSSLSAIKMVSSAFLRLLIFLPAVLIPGCDSSSLAFCMMCSGYKLNKQGDSIQL